MRSERGSGTAGARLASGRSGSAKEIRNVSSSAKVRS